MNRGTPMSNSGARKRLAEAQRGDEAGDVEALTGARLIAAERLRQIESEGWTAEHDAQHSVGALLRAAEAYEFLDPSRWPWDWKWWKPKDHLSNLVRAGALYQAACDRGAAGHAPSIARCAGQIDAILMSPVLAARDAEQRRLGREEGAALRRRFYDEGVEHGAGAVVAAVEGAYARAQTTTSRGDRPFWAKVLLDAARAAAQQVSER